MRSKLLGCLCLLWLQLAGAGCANYEFDLTRPADLGTHIGAKDTLVSRGPLDYRFNSIDGRLVMRIFNTTADPIQLLGDQSSVVDPKSQSHPLHNLAIAPQSFVKIIFPPMHPQNQQNGPSIGLGLGFLVDSEPARSQGSRFGDDPFIDRRVDAEQPEYFYVMEDSEQYWDWDGETDIHLSLVFSQAEKRFTQEFIFRRVKV